ncbi:MAG: arginine--tRNA ligase [bacterium]|nr:arginine--tRNA ligase [bacterium]
MTIYNEIINLLETAVKAAAADFKDKTFNWSSDKFFLTLPGNEKFGDYASNIAFYGAAFYEKSPRELAKLIVDKLPQDKNLLEKVEVAGNGFINFFVAKERVYKELSEILAPHGKYGQTSAGKGKHIQIEFVSANPTGPLHVGHGRGAATGDTLARIFNALGYQVQKEYYVNNIGNQMNILGKSVQARYEDKEIPEDGYKGDYIKEIAEQIAAGALPASVGGQGRQMADENAFREYAINTILEWIKKDLEDFGVVFDTWFFENTLYEGKDLKKELLDKLNHEYPAKTYEEDSAVFVKTTDFGDDKDRVIFRADGRPTYFASDIAYLINKFERKPPLNQVINIWGADHHGYVPRMEAVASMLGYKEKLKIILYQLVSLKRGKETVPMSTRAGEFVTLRQVLDEVGKDACRFFFLMRSPDSALDFDLELAKKHSSDNPVYYVQYAHARISSVFKEAVKNSLMLDAGSSKTETLNLLQEPEEMQLIKKLANFSKILADCARTYDPHWLTIYLQELATVFHNFYTKHRIVTDNRELSLARLNLIKAVSIILKDGLDLLGISAPEKM